MPRAQRESGHKVKVIRTDNGGEFIGADFESVLKKKGIQHQLTVPYNPQQNDVAEQFNRTLPEGARTLLGRAGLPDPFWVTALRQVALVKNRVLVTGGQAGWLIWDLTSQQLTVSKDVKFLESLYYKEWKQQQQKLPITPLIIEADEVQRPSRQVQVTVSEEKIFGVTEDGGEPEVEEQQQQDAPQGAQRPPDRPRRDVRPPNRLTYPSFGKPKVVQAGSVAEQCDEEEIAHCYWAAVPEPKMLAEALSGPDAEKWKQSVKEEYDSLLENETWELCELPPEKKAISSKLIFRHKYGPDGELTRYKSRLVAKGFQQTKGKDFDEIFAPVGKGTTLRVMLGMAANRGWRIKQMDITTAFLNGIILEDLYMLQPEGLDDGSGRVCRLKKAIYGLKQAPRAWYHKLEETLLAGGFKKSECDHSLFLLQEKEQFRMLLVYVDDILLFSKSSAMIEHVEKMLEMQFKCSKMGDVKYYLGMHVERDLDKGVLRLHQRKYCEGLAEKYGLQDGGKPATRLPSGLTVEPCADEEVVGLYLPCRPRLPRPASLASRGGSAPLLTPPPLQTLHMDVWGPARVVGQSRERYFLLVVDDYTRYTTVFPLRSKGQDLPVLRLHSDRGGEFSSNLLRKFCCGEGILQSFTFPESPQQSGIAERRIGLVMEVARTSLIHGDAPHFLWPFAVDYAGHQLNLWPRVSLPETSPTLRWTGEDVTFDNLVPFYRLFPYRSTPPPPPLLFLAPSPPPVAVGSGAARGAASWGAASGGAEPRGVGSEGAETGGGEPGGVGTGGAEPGGAESKGVEPGGAASQGAEGAEWGGAEPQGADSSGGAGAAGARGAGVAAGASGAGGAAATGPGGARTQGTGASGTGGVEGAGVVGPGAAGAGAAVAGVEGTGAGGTGAFDPCAGGTGGTVQPRPPPPHCLLPLLTLSSPSRPVSPVRTARCAPRSRPPNVPGTHAMALRPSSVPLHVPVPAPPESSLPEVPDPDSDRARAVRPAVSRLLATAVTDPSFESAAACALMGELLDFAAACHLDYATALVAESASASPPSVGGECALGTDVFEDRQEDFECLAAAVPRFTSMLLAPEGDPDAPDIPAPCSYAKEITGPYSSQWQSAMDAEMAFWKSTGTYIDEVPPPGENIVDGMWIFRVKRPLGSTPAFKTRYVARGFSQRQGVDHFQTFSPTPKMTTLRVLLHVAAQRDYELHSQDFSTAFLQGSLHEEIWLRRPPGFTGLFPASTQWSLCRPVYGLRQTPREWHNTLRTTLAALGFAPSTADPSLFLRTDTSLPPFYVLVYVDDLVFATADTEALTLVKSELQKRHICTDLGELRSYLGLLITRDRARRTITLTQSHMVHQVLQRFGFQFSSPQLTPLSTSHSLSAPPSDESVEPSGLYPELVGCLMYLISCTRPDPAYPLSLLAHYVAPGRHRKVH
ncbi:unnamed protein product [Closterium sp. NIES-54]